MTAGPGFQPSCLPVFAIHRRGYAKRVPTTMSYHEARRLSVLDRELAGDRTLRAVVDLFAQPPVCSPATAPRRVPHALRHVGLCPAAVVLTCVAAVAGLLCCAVSAVLVLPLVALVGGVATGCAAMFFAVSAVRSAGGNATD